MFYGPMSSKIFTDFVDLTSVKQDKKVSIFLTMLNRIEKFWPTVKPRWMEVKCRTFIELQEDVNEIFDNFGGKFNFSFNAK